uniref:Uncharacterized protein n=1 Tax=Kalanchoe fedtschenkoi TaxID=63787 RepID=A0A7N0UYY2_KALFE
MVKIAVGSFKDSMASEVLKAYLVEFISTFMFVFAGVGSAIAYGKLTSDAATDPAGLVAVAVCHAFALFVAVAVGANVSGGHVNPAVTLGLALGGQITLITAFMYAHFQVGGAILACYALKFVTGGLAIPVHALGAGVGPLQGLVLEIIITFVLVYTVCATAADPKKGSMGTIAPIAIGFIVGANILAAGPFSGGSMNPARSVGPAFVTGDFQNLWVYMAGPLIGGALAGLFYGNVLMPSAHIPLNDDYC